MMETRTTLFTSLDVREALPHALCSALSLGMLWALCSTMLLSWTVAVIALLYLSAALSLSSLSFL